MYPHKTKMLIQETPQFYLWTSQILEINPVACVLFLGAFLYYSLEYGVVGWGPRGEMGQGGEILRTSSKISAFAKNGNFTAREYGLLDDMVQNGLIHLFW